MSSIRDDTLCYHPSAEYLTDVLVLDRGRVVDVAHVDPRAGAIDAMNRAAAGDPRLEALILPVRDGSDGILVGVIREGRRA